MLDGISLVPTEWSPVAIVSLVILMILTGWLVPRFYYKELKEDRNRLIQKDEFNQETIRILAESVKPMVESGKTQVSFLSSIQREVVTRQEEKAADDEVV